MVKIPGNVHESHWESLKTIIRQRSSTKQMEYMVFMVFILLCYSSASNIAVKYKHRFKYIHLMGGLILIRKCNSNGKKYSYSPYWFIFVIGKINTPAYKLHKWTYLAPWGVWFLLFYFDSVSFKYLPSKNHLR